MTKTQTVLLTTDDVIDKLGGNDKVAEIVGTTPNAVRNWRTKLRGRFPRTTVIALQEALQHNHMAAPLSLWGMKDPVRRSA